MKSLKFVLDPGEFVNAEEFFKKGADWIDLLDTVTQKPIEWFISELSYGSAAIAIRPQEEEEGPRIGFDAFKIIIGGMQKLQNGLRPEDWSPETVSKAETFVKDLVPTNDKIRAHLYLVDDGRVEDEVSLTQNIATELFKWEPPIRMFAGSVRGDLVGMSVSRGHRASLRLPNGRIAQVWFDPEQDINIKSALLEKVELTGILKKDANDNVYFIRASGVEVLENNPRLKWRDLFGILPNFTGDLSTEEYLARARGEE